MFPMRRGNSTKSLLVRTGELNVINATFPEFQQALVSCIKNLIGTKGDLLGSWVLSCSSNGKSMDLTPAQPDDKNRISIEFTMGDKSWDKVKMYNRLYTQVIMQFVAMSIVSYMIDTTTKPLVDHKAARQICKNAVATGLSGLLDPTRFADARPVSPTRNFDTYYVGLAAVLSGISGDSATVEYDSTEKTLLISIKDKTQPVEVISINTRFVQFAEDDMYIINASVACAIISFVQTSDAILIKRLPHLVTVYTVTRQLAPYHSYVARPVGSHPWLERSTTNNTFRVGTGTKLVLLNGDLTTQQVDAIVNAANERMLGGGGVDGAIHTAAGDDLKAACETVKPTHDNCRCPTGEARITPGFKLKSKFVIHTVGPDCSSGWTGSEPSLLSAAHRNSLILAKENGLKSIAFCGISIGAFSYPIPEAAKVAMQAVLDEADGLDEIFFVLDKDPNLSHYIHAAAGFFPDWSPAAT